MMSIGNWYCMAHGADCPPIPWASGEPNSAMENCVCLWPSFADGVNDCTCLDLFPFICEYNMHDVVLRKSTIFEPTFQPGLAPV